MLYITCIGKSSMSRKLFSMPQSLLFTSATMRYIWYNTLLILSNIPEHLILTSHHEWVRFMFFSFYSLSCLVNVCWVLSLWYWSWSSFFIALFCPRWTILNISQWILINHARHTHHFNSDVWMISNYAWDRCHLLFHNSIRPHFDI